MKKKTIKKIERWISSGKCFDDLNDREQEQYCEYLGIKRDIVIAMQQIISDAEGKPCSLHFPLLKRREELTETDIEYINQMRETLLKAAKRCPELTQKN